MIRYFWPSDDEQLAGQAIDSHFDEDGSWWASVQQSGAVFALATALTLTAASTALASSVFSQSQDDPAGSLSTQVLAIEEYAQPLVAPANWPQPSVFTDDDAHPTFVQVFFPDDGDWRPLVAPVPDANYVRLPFLEPDESPQFVAASPVVDAQEPWGPQPPPQEQNWTLLFFLDDGSAVPVFQYDEDFASPQIPPQNWPQPQQPFASHDDLLPQVPAYDDVWLQLVPPVSQTFVWPQQWFFEQNESTNLVAFTAEEHAWPVPVPVPATLALVQQWPFEQNDPAGNLSAPAFEETLWQNRVFPVPDSLRLLQPWQFEQNEPGGLRTNIDELYWLNWVPAISGYPVPAIYFQLFGGSADEIVVQQSTATVDEIYWGPQVSPIIFPVQATSLLVYPYQPDPEEIPAGSLVPFIPPPPAFCPLPPTGPDKDIRMSNFNTSAGGPILALFCRICNSGKPLVVRADYAIWCQDCCAFVSKQDTYMGTTRAPGAFKNRF